MYKGLGKKVVLLSDYSEKYPGKGDLGITDGEIGTTNYKESCWQGYNGNDFIAIIDLEKLTNISSISCRFLNFPRGWIFPPKDVQISVSDDGNTFQNITKISSPVEPKNDMENIEIFKKSFDSLKSRYIKIHAKNYGVLPDWHVGKGSPSWLFVDEVIIE